MRSFRSFRRRASTLSEFFFWMLLCVFVMKCEGVKALWFGLVKVNGVSLVLCGPLNFDVLGIN